MTEKRFWCLKEYERETSPIVDGGFAPTNGWLCYKLNELYEENEQLKKDNEHIETCFKMANSTYHMLQKQYHNRESAISKYRKENERLKKENNKLKHSTGIEGLKMAGKILIELKSYRDDEKFVEVESDEEMSLEEAVDCVIEYWADMGATYYSWDCKKIIFE